MLLGVSALLAMATVPAFASCAESETSAGRDVDASVIAPGTDAGTEDAEPVDAGCRPTDENCVTHQLSCDEAPWCPVATGVSGFYALTAIWGSSKNDVWAVGSGGTIVHWDGAKWTATPASVKNTFNAIWGSGPDNVWIASATDTVFHASGFAGADTLWARESLPVDEDNQAPIFAIWGSGAGDVRLAGQSFAMPVPGTEDFISVNGLTRETLPGGGSEWRGSLGTATVQGLWGSAADDVWAVADNSTNVKWQLGLTLHGTEAPGADDLEWTEVDSRSSVRLRSVWGSSPNDIWAVGDIGTIRHVTSADAKQWQVVASPTRERLHAVWGSATDDVWAVGEAGTILHYDGKAWTKTIAAFPLGKKPTLYGVWGSGRNDVWIVGNGIALHYTGGAIVDAGGAP